MLSNWTFLSNHAHVLICLSRNRDIRLRDVAEEVDITERAVQKIVKDLEDVHVISIEKEGRRNRYKINPDVKLRHPVEAHCSVGDLLNALSSQTKDESLSD